MSGMGKDAVISLSMNKLIVISLAYLYVNVAFFLIGWYAPCFSIPLCAAGGLCLYIIARNLRDADEICWSLRWGDICLLAFLFGIVVLGVMETGLVGGFATHHDYYAFRNGLYHNLIDAAWPLVLPDKREMSYYLCGMLVPASLARLTSQYEIQQWLLLLWSCVPIFFALCLMFHKLQRFSWILLLVALFSLSPVEGGWNGTCLGRLMEYLCRDCLHLSWNETPIIGRWKCVVAKPALLAAISPLGAVGIFPLAVVAYFQGCKREGSIKPADYGFTLVYSCLLACCWLLYFSRSESDVFVGLTSECWGFTTCMMWYVPTQVVLVLMCYHLFLLQKKDPLFLSLIILISIVPLLFIGSSPRNFSGLNELWLKSQPAYAMLLAYYLAASIDKLPRWVVVLWVCCTLIQVWTFVSRITEYDSTIEIKDSLNGHLYHPQHDFLKQSCPDCKPPKIKGIILQESGASERTFPGNLLPSAPGCDYSRPLQL